MLVKLTFFLVSVLLCVSPLGLAQQPSPASPATQALPPSTDRTQQMRADLNQMESLMNNMQSEINFLRDQNLQILLNTNVRMWTILIRDLRTQLDAEQQCHPTGSAPGQPPAHKSQ